MKINTRHNMKNNLHFLNKVAGGLRIMKAAMSLVAALLLMPLPISAGRQSSPEWQDMESWYPFSNADYNNSGSTPYITWRTVLFDDNGDDEGFFIHNKQALGDSRKLNVYITVGNDEEQYCGYLACDEYCDPNYSGLFISNTRVSNWGSPSWAYGGSWSFGYDKYTYGSGDDWARYVQVCWYLPFEYRNCNIKVRVQGSWGKWSSHDHKDVEKTHTFNCSYTFNVRQIYWNGEYSLAPDGTVTIPYKFEGTARNTDEKTHICTMIDGSYNGTIGGRSPAANYANGSYSFRLSEIGKGMRSQFNIEPYHEFAHYRDKDAGNGTKYYATFAGPKTFLPLPVATIQNAEFQQAEKQVMITWTASNANYGNGKWVIYRNNTKIAEVAQNVYSYTDKSFANESNEKYKIYYVLGGWNTDTRINELCSSEFTVNTTRHIPIRNFNAGSQTDYIALTWQSDSLPAGWGHRFYVYVDNEATPVDTIIPAGGQTSFVWEHRNTDQHTDRQNGTEGNTHYTAEPLNATNPHSYRVASFIGELKREEVSTNNKISIGTGTTFYSMEASKNSYAGRVELSWHVNRQGSEVSQTYTISRRRAEKTAETWTRLDGFSSTDDYLFYTDNTPLPGVCYEYRIHIEERRPDGTLFTRNATDIGFAQASGTISGRITFGTSGMAVAGVEVEAKQIGEEDAEEQYHAVRFTGENGQLIWNYPSENYASGIFSTTPWSIQMWINPDSLKVCRITDFIGMSADGAIQVQATGTTYTFPQVKLKANEYRHLTLTRSGNTLTAHVIFVNEDSLAVDNSQTVTLTDSIEFNQSRLSIGGFKGYVDEFRLWTKCLTEKEIKDNYDHLLVGSERYLETYWTFDEGLNTQFFDYARDGSVYREHHGKMSVNTQSSSYTPDRLALRARTDSIGNYIIRGVPFSGEGTTYAIIPMLGVHSFNPTQHLRYVSANSLVHNGTDFNDVSSFPVSGTVYYAGTNYPVEGCNFYVDGQVCSKDGELIETNSYGQFTISVPIGEHFIQVKKQGHVFVNEGRFPDKKKGTEEFNQEKRNLTFYDSTLVNFTGRVAGGNIEGDKPVGFGQSTNNIGMATLTLAPRNIENTNYFINAILPTEGTVIQYEPNPNIDTIASAKPDIIRSTAWRGYGNADECKRFHIRTDSLTGEFSAMLPPMDYIVERIEVASSPELEILKNQIAVDMTNPLMTNKDSTQTGNDSTMRYYEYHTKLVPTYHSEPSFSVVQRGHEDGSFGIDSIDIEDAFGTMHINDIHHLKADTVEYTYGYPLFVMGDPYVFDIEGFEPYVNKDGTEDVFDRVPLANMVVTIENALSDDQAVCSENNTLDSIPGSVYELKSNQLALDSAGRASYTWHAGIPNITSPFTRTVNIYYDINDRHYNWSMNPMSAIVLGDMPTGSNFVTAGPDRVQMILRDPPGSGSSASWETGSSTSTTKVSTRNISTENSLKVKESVGIEMEVGAGLGLMVITKTKVVAEATQGLTVSAEWKNASSYSTTISTSKTISTSSDGDFDGADGDVFIGTSTNILFGKVRNVALYRNTDDTTKAHVDLHDAMSTGLQFTTCFSYTQSYIKEYLIPNLRMLRDSCLVHAADPTSVTNSGAMPIYVTALFPDDPNYGKAGTYRMIAPANATQSFCDTILYFNNQIANWGNQLALNEKEKVEAYDHRAELESKGLMTNYSFDAGTSIEMSKTNETSNSESSENSWSVVTTLGSSAGFEVNECGMSYEFEDKTGGGETSEKEQETTTTTTFSFTLEDGDEGDAISVDVYSGQGLFGSPIFRTRGGQTSNPYEAEVKTEYYQPGTTIMEATMQIEMPKIDVVQPIVTNVISGTAANFELHLMNQSETNANCTFKLYAVDASNPHGAQLIIDGAPLTGEGRLIRVPYGETLVKSLQLRQSDAGILDYENIELVLASKNQGSIRDKALITAHFVPSSSPVTLAVNTNIINTHTDTVLVLTMKDFDRNFYNLKAFRIQYKQQGGDWTDLHEYVLQGSNLSSIQQLLPDSMNIIYRLSMKNSKAWADATYTFRIVSVSTYGTDEVYVYSNEETVVKDTSYPRPLGQAEPADGVLNIGDELSITYNMPFLRGALTPENFLVTGVVNGAPVEHLSALRTYSDTTMAAARTEASINLSGKDYSLDAWLNIHSAGTLLRHGADKQKMEIRTDEAGHLVVAFFGDSVVYTSTQVIPRDRWLFFTLSRKAVNNHGKISVAIAEGSNDPFYPFADLDAPIYYGNGPLSIGLGAEAAVHEVLLWDETRDVQTALSQRSVTKTPSTRHLIGYWKMDEGEGKTIRDYARNRHMVMPQETWYLNNVNKALALDGTQHLAVCTANVPPLPQDDYAAELWLKAGTQTDTAQVFQLGDVSMWLDNNGKLHLQSGENEQIVNSKSPVTDNLWHHIMLNVRRYGTAAVYIDGERAHTVNASFIGDFASDSLLVGVRRTRISETDSTAAHYRYDRHLTGSVDEIRLWKTTIASDMLATKRKIRLTGQEPGLSLYYPFEKKQLDDNTQIVTLGSLEEMTGHGTPATLNSPIVNFTDDAPSLKEKPTQTNVAFSFTASDTKIVIDIDELPATVDGCTLNFTVKDIRSVNGNPSLPATWSAFIHRNELEWQDSELTVVQGQGTSSTFSTAIINKSGISERWVLNGFPTWLTASQTSGIVAPLEKTNITFTLSESTPIGKYERTIYLIGDNGVETPLTLHITVTGDIPDWNVNPDGYESLMSIVAELSFFGMASDDPDDMVAAFVGDECRGVAHMQYKERYDRYFATLAVYGNDSTDKNQPVTFRAYDASQGIYYNSVQAGETVKYKSLGTVGSYANPITLTVIDRMDQQTMLHKGWNWLSLFVVPDNMSPTAIFRDIAEDVEVVKGKTAALIHEDTVWSGTLTTMYHQYMYKVKMKADRELHIVGNRVEPQTHPVTVYTGWNWLGYYEMLRYSVADAMAGMNPQTGDLLMAKRGVSYYEDFEWVGTLQSMEPGQGYILFNTDTTKQFSYPSTSIAYAPRRASAAFVGEELLDEDTPYVGSFLPVSDHAYPHNMILVGHVLLDNEPAANAELGVFEGDECRTAGRTDAEGRIMLLVPGEDELTLNYRLALGGQRYETVETLPYETDAIVGAYRLPHTIRFGIGQGIQSVTDSPSLDTRKVFRNGILYILRGGKTYTAIGQEVK